MCHIWKKIFFFGVRMGFFFSHFVHLFYAFLCVNTQLLLKLWHWDSCQTFVPIINVCVLCAHIGLVCAFFFILGWFCFLLRWFLRCINAVLSSMQSFGCCVFFSLCISLPLIVRCSKAFFSHYGTLRAHCAPMHSHINTHLYGAPRHILIGTFVCVCVFFRVLRDCVSSLHTCYTRSSGIRARKFDLMHLHTFRPIAERRTVFLSFFCWLFVKKSHTCTTIYRRLGKMHTHFFPLHLLISKVCATQLSIRT